MIFVSVVQLQSALDLAAVEVNLERLLTVMQNV